MDTWNENFTLAKYELSIYSFDGRPNITQIHISIIYFQKHAAEKQIATIQ